MRAPGENAGHVRARSAMDELAYALKIDPFAAAPPQITPMKIRRGQAVVEQIAERMLRQAAERFGWSQRNPEPRSMRDGR